MDISLRGWLRTLEECGKLKTVSRAVDARFEAAAVAKKLSPDYCVRFDNIKGHTVPVVCGLASTREDFAKSMGLTVHELMERFNQALERPVPCELVPGEGCAVKERIIQGADVDLERILPACVHHEKDAGKFLTAAMLITKDPETGIRNVAIHRHQLKGGNKLGALLLPRHTWSIFGKAESRGKPLEVALVIGCHPALLLSSQATTRLGVDEFEIAGALTGAPVKMVKCETVDLEVPVECEFVLEGRLLPNIRESEGPFGEYPRTYGPESSKHVLEITCVTHRAQPIYHTIVPATTEHLLLGAIPREAVMTQLIRQAGPNVLAVNLTPAGGCRYHCVIQIDKRNAGEAKNAMFAAFTSSTEVKHVVVVDKDVDPFDPYDVEWAISTRCQAGRDVFIVRGAMGNKLDPSSDNGVSDKMGIDATIPWTDPNREHFLKMEIPGLDAIDLSEYLD